MKGFAIYNWISHNLDDLILDRDKRTLISVGCLDQAIEHHVAICTLLKHQINGSAFALVRLVFEAFIRGVWLGNSATEAQINQYSNDKLDIKFGTLINDVQKIDGFESKLFEELKDQAWNAMNSYTHTGIMQVGRRFGKEFVYPSYKDEEIIEILKISGSFALLAFQQIAGAGNRLDLANEATRKLSESMEEFNGFN